MTSGEAENEHRLQSIADELRLATGASRTTIRGPMPGEETTIALLAESLADGIESMHGGPQAGIVEAETYTYLRETLEILVQPDCARGPKPPETLTDGYGIRAQLLGPLVVGATVIGTVSVHQKDSTRNWTSSDIEALKTAVRHVRDEWKLDS
jgi:maleate isomerase